MTARWIENPSDSDYRPRKLFIRHDRLSTEPSLLTLGYEYNELVHCNIYPEGLPLNTWIHSFHADVERKKVLRNGEEIHPDAAGIYH